ncbi:hypothetical protein B7463_g6663, partial [Scytalidium lignicola]
MPPPVASVTRGLTITNPLVLYRSLLATKKIEPDLAQYRLALHLQKLYDRLKDYSPEIEYEDRLKALTQVIGTASAEDKEVVASRRYPLRRNPLFTHLFLNKERRNSVALTRVITNHEAVKELNSPKGLLLHGEVGRGKSMLMDLLADSLPTNKKRRWHFNTFILETLARLEQLRVKRSRAITENPEYSLLLLARDMIDTSPMLFLDEFQLPDRAASKILSNLFTIFFQLGGVLIATSNRMPDELAKASGTDFTAPSTGSRIASSLGMMGHEKGVIYPANSEYHDFVEILKARCDIFNMDNMEPGRDWRRREIEEIDSDQERGQLPVQTVYNENTEHYMGEISTRSSIEGPGSQEEFKTNKVKVPKKYIVGMTNAEKKWDRAIKETMPPHTQEQIPWKSTTLLVYGRNVSVPLQYEGITSWIFSQLCGERFGPADYITMASTFHTFIIDEIPILTLSLKNEARRLITLLDALYEARCKLIIRAEAGPDELFFPETKASANIADNTEKLKHDENDGVDAVYPETLSEVYQDQTSPFRPNVSSYVDENGKDYDFNKDLVSTRGSKRHDTDRSIDFGMTSSLIGEDERFSYKRASSRLWEMCGTQWHSRSEPGWWRPISSDIRRWELSSTPQVKTPNISLPAESDVRMGESYELEKPAGLQGRLWEDAQDPPRITDVEPPRFNWTHAWGMMKWGKKAGAWGQGPEGLNDRKKDRNR